MFSKEYIDKKSLKFQKKNHHTEMFASQEKNVNTTKTWYVYPICVHAPIRMFITGMEPIAVKIIFSISFNQTFNISDFFKLPFNQSMEAAA